MKEFSETLFAIFIIITCLILILKCDCQAEKEDDVYIKGNCTVVNQNIGTLITETEYKCNDGSIRKVNHF